MTTLSITFHCTAPQLENWSNYLKEELLPTIEELTSIERYLFSEVQTEMIEEGKNFNLLLLFTTEKNRTDFIEQETQPIIEKIEAKFAKEVMVFVTFLNPIQYRLDGNS